MHLFNLIKSAKLIMFNDGLNGTDAFKRAIEEDTNRCAEFLGTIQMKSGRQEALTGYDEVRDTIMSNMSSQAYNLIISEEL